MKVWAYIYLQSKAIRQWNEQIKQAINNAQSLDVLNSIVIEFKG